MNNTDVGDIFLELLRNAFGNILGFIRVVGIGLALIMLAYMSISYFTADGRGMPMANEKRAHLKSDQLMNFAIGVAIFIGAGSILRFLVDIILDIF